jgi:hypothetical protein
MDMINQHVGNSAKQKQEILAYCQIAMYITNIINYKIAYLKVLMDHHFKEYAQNQIKPTSSSPMLIFVIYDNKSNYKEEGEVGEKDGK